VPRQFSEEIGEWPENQILIPDWTYFDCPDSNRVMQHQHHVQVAPDEDSSLLLETQTKKRPQYKSLLTFTCLCMLFFIAATVILAIGIPLTLRDCTSSLGLHP